ncbi:hypothetical protein D9758_010477 [Tetrapyrgos nigripes]|uniref:Transcription regulator Rua1 C-terminal domain-containing protein n=1 Tax=Tetrapyrgos nigripes TaxID=182062 RepID=A0A8H5CZP1_9AGAR|nr:hypothetical protein D9758_010477 [Tetrapyrgos nigripes]
MSLQVVESSFSSAIIDDLDGLELQYPDESKWDEDVDNRPSTIDPKIIPIETPSRQNPTPLNRQASDCTEPAASPFHYSSRQSKPMILPSVVLERFNAVQTLFDFPETPKQSAVHSLPTTRAPSSLFITPFANVSNLYRSPPGTLHNTAVPDGHYSYPNHSSNTVAPSISDSSPARSHFILRPVDAAFSSNGTQDINTTSPSIACECSSPSFSEYLKSPSPLIVSKRSYSSANSSSGTPLLQSLARRVPPTPLTPLTPVSDNDPHSPIKALSLPVHLTDSATGPTLTVDMPSVTPKKPVKLNSAGKRRQFTENESSSPLKRRRVVHLPTRRSQRLAAPGLSSNPASPWPSASPQTNEVPSNPSSRTSRVIPDTFEVAADLPLFYRRFHASSYFQLPQDQPHCALLQESLPGGSYNPPRGGDPFDLYTPRIVKGRGRDKMGLCPICIESPERGGEGKKVWLSMKFSAYKCYHMQYRHASSAQPFLPPASFQTIQRRAPQSNEKVEIRSGKCHQCKKWVAVEGIKDIDVKVKEIFWWKHAAACHKSSIRIQDVDDFFEHDDVFTILKEL